MRDFKVGDHDIRFPDQVYKKRIAVHKYLHEGGALPDYELRRCIIYHCGPMVVKDENGNHGR